jgi:prephenate dehydratase
MLMALPGTQVADLRRVHSHPQALAQCHRYLTRHSLEPVAAFDTAGSARDLAASAESTVAQSSSVGAPRPSAVGIPRPSAVGIPRPSAVGVIASELAAELYGLEILDRGIEDFPFNFTRFFVLSREDAPRAQRSKTSIVFTTPHQPGSLYACMGEFATRRINLTKIESRPRLNRPWQYIFYVDFEGHTQDPACEAALIGLLRRSSFVKLLGSYPAAMTPMVDAED